MRDFLINLLYAVITAAVPVITVYLIKFLATKFDKAKVETEQLVFNDTISSALDLILRVVMSTSQTYVDSLKASGTFNEEAQKKAFNDTKTKILSLLTEESKSVITALYSDLDEWLDVQIENAVRQIKN